jgi:REP element-mobilizing transposase RayT
LVCQSSDSPIFNTPKRRQRYLEIVGGCAKTYNVKILAWSVLRDKSYFVLVPPSAEAMSSFMRVVHTRYARYLHATGHEGDVTPRRFASCPLDNAAALEAIKYVESRPVAERLARSVKDYPFSSVAARTNGRDGGELLSEAPEITRRVDSWLKWHADELPEARVTYLAMRMRTGKPAGEAGFVKRVEKMVGMNLSRGRGRPKGT